MLNGCEKNVFKGSSINYVDQRGGFDQNKKNEFINLYGKIVHKFESSFNNVLKSVFKFTLKSVLFKKIVTNHFAHKICKNCPI